MAWNCMHCVTLKLSIPTTNNIIVEFKNLDYMSIRTSYSIFLQGWLTHSKILGGTWPQITTLSSFILSEHLLNNGIMFCVLWEKIKKKSLPSLLLILEIQFPEVKCLAIRINSLRNPWQIYQKEVYLRSVPNSYEGKSERAGKLQRLPKDLCVFLEKYKEAPLATNTNQPPRGLQPSQSHLLYMWIKKEPQNPAIVQGLCQIHV